MWPKPLEQKAVLRGLTERLNAEGAGISMAPPPSEGAKRPGSAPRQPCSPQLAKLGTSGHDPRALANARELRKSKLQGRTSLASTRRHLYCRCTLGMLGLGCDAKQDGPTPPSTAPTGEFHSTAGSLPEAFSDCAAARQEVAMPICSWVSGSLRIYHCIYARGSRTCAAARQV